MTDEESNSRFAISIDKDKLDKAFGAAKFLGVVGFYTLLGWSEAETSTDSDTDDEPRCERCGHELKRSVADDMNDSHIGVCYECKVEISDKERHVIRNADKTLHVIPRAGDEQTAWLDGEA